MAVKYFDYFHTIVRCHSLLLLHLLLLFLFLLVSLVSLVVDERITKGPCSFPGVTVFCTLALK
jgi:hypothetical protein